MVRKYFNKAFYGLSNNKKILNILFLITWLIVIINIIWASWNSRKQISEIFTSIDISHIWAILGYYLLTLVIAVACWSSIINSIAPGIDPWKHIQIYYSSMFTRRLPGTIWYIGGRAIFYEKLKVSKTKTVTASIIEIVVGFLADCIIGIFFLGQLNSYSPVWLVIIFCTMILGFFSLRPKSLQWIMAKLKHPLTRPIRYRDPLIWVTLRLCSIIIGGLMITQIIGVFYSLNNSDIVYVIGARAISGLAGYLTYLLPSSLGASDLTTIMLLSRLIPASVATLVAIIIRVFTTLGELLFSGIFYFNDAEWPFVASHTGNR